MDKVRERTEDFFSMVKAEIKYNCPSIQGILFLGSFIRGDTYNDIDIITVLTGPYKNTEELIEEFKKQEKRFEYALAHASVWNIPPIHNHRYISILKNSQIPDILVDDFCKEQAQFETQVRSFYDHYKGFNRLEDHVRLEYGISKSPSDFRISPDYLVFIERDPLDFLFVNKIKESLRKINSEYEPEIAAYSKEV